MKSDGGPGALQCTAGVWSLGVSEYERRGIRGVVSSTLPQVPDA